MDPTADNTKAQPVQFPTLRKDIISYPGPRSFKGEPTWTLHDPSRNRFFRIGWLEFEILKRLELREMEAIVTSIEAETPLTTDPEQVTAFLRYLTVNSLVNAVGDEGFDRLRAQSVSLTQHWTKTLLHSYLFFRIPLIRPDRFLVRTLPFVDWMFSERFLAAISFLALFGLYLVARQWDAFFSTFSYLFSWQGAAFFAITLSAIKIVHEFGHAYAARHYGCRVPTMGVAFLVMWPVLFTELSEVSKLPSKRQRLAIGSAGMLAEVILAVLATLVWIFSPGGITRSIAMFVATTNWIMTLALNLSPFLRFDGYYLLSDWLEIENLHERSSALGRWWMRRLLLGMDQPCPETLPRDRRRFLILFAYATWLYRFILFLGIALLVYHYFFKIAGVFLMVVEVGWFIALPIIRELSYWFKNRKEMTENLNAKITAFVIFSSLVFVAMPWKTRVEAPAIMETGRHARIFSSAPGQVESLTVKTGDIVPKGALLLRLSSPEMEYRMAQSRNEVKISQWQRDFQSMDPQMLDQSPVIQRELETGLTEYHGILREQEKMSLVAPFSGEVIAVSEHLKNGDWIGQDEWLLELVVRNEWFLEAFVEESDLGRISVGAEGIFYPEILDWPPVRARVTKIDAVGTRELSDPYLVSSFGGDIPVKQDLQAHKGDRKEWIPETSIYRVVLVPEESPRNLNRLLRGTVLMEGAPRSPLSRIWKSVVAVFVRESGF
ncbi:MAG: HlyD family efflux transporter periplasmic adaptor subunit [Magnetococcales bacterium]|nr:HlyD family efflux transporter periplasmic adaptor subunit [Magnetococcales bacterium]